MSGFLRADAHQVDVDAIVVGAGGASAGSPRQVRDINSRNVTIGSAPTDFVDLDAWSVFVADDGILGSEPWLTDGTAAGTFMLTEVRPGSAGAGVYSFRGLDNGKALILPIATPTEAGALGAIGGMVLAALHKRLNWSLVWQAMDSTMRVTAMVIFILLGSSVFSLVFQGVDGNKWIEHLLSNLPGGPVGFLIVVNLFVFFLAFFLDFFEIAFIVVPLLTPVAQKLGIDLVWFGVLLCVNMQTSFMHPPFGFALFYLRGVADQIHKSGAIAKPIQSKDIYLGAIPWVLMQLGLVAVVIFWPESVTYWLDKEQVVNTDDVHIEMKIEDTSGEPEAPVLPEGASQPASSPEEADGAMPAMPQPAQAEDDPTQAVKDALKAR